jgi:hypothetical protein
MDDEARVRLVKQWSFAPDEYRDQFATWGRQAYHTPGEYTRGERPGYAMVPEIDINSGANNSYAWNWEARVTAEAGSCATLHPVRVAMSRPQWRAYGTWVRGLDLPLAEYTHHMDWLASIRLEYGDDSCAYDVMTAFLEGEPQW